MLVDKNLLESHNADLIAKHQKKFSILKEEVIGVEAIIEKLVAYQIAIPS